MADVNREEFLKEERLVNANPAPNAIVGMWRHRDSMTNGVKMWEAVLFDDNHSGFQRTSDNGGGPGLNDRMNWHYKGGGWWETNPPVTHNTLLWRMTTNGNLLQYGEERDGSPYPLLYKVFHRVE